MADLLENTPLGKKDTLFQKSLYPRGGFVFDGRVAEVFDDMLHRSIPYYREVMEMSRNFLLQKGLRGIIYDLGSSTGNFLLNLAARDFEKKFEEYRGIDSSPAMVEKAKWKLRGEQENGRIATETRMTFYCDDLLSHPYSASAAFTLHYTLQFIDPQLRGAFLKKLHSLLLPGGLLILSEKVKENHDCFNEFFTSRYHDFKTTNRYTAEEIARKKEALEEVLIPFTLDHYGQLLHEAGFQKNAVSFKWYNFTTWFAMK